MMRQFIRLLLVGSGASVALLLGRAVLRLFAARPDNPVFAGLFALTAPLVAPFLALDAGQPRFGAVLEFSTLAAASSLLVFVVLLQLLIRQQPQRQRSRRAR